MILLRLAACYRGLSVEYEPCFWIPWMFFVRGVNSIGRVSTGRPADRRPRFFMKSETACYCWPYIRNIRRIPSLHSAKYGTTSAACSKQELAYNEVQICATKNGLQCQKSSRVVVFGKPGRQPPGPVTAGRHLVDKRHSWNSVKRRVLTAVMPWPPMGAQSRERLCSPPPFECRLCWRVFR